jgi:hypothetical protein
MTTTVQIASDRSLELPEEFCRRKKIAAGSALRLVEVGDGFYLTPAEEPSLPELEKLLEQAGAFQRPESPDEEAEVERHIREVRKEKQRASL